MSSFDLLVLVLQVLQAADRRAVVLGGWARLEVLAQDLMAGRELEDSAGLDAGELAELAGVARDRCCFVSSVPHSWLLPRCSCILHHGGAGTTQTALRCGCPCVITPVWIDQFWWAKTVSRLQVGVGFQQTLEDLAGQPGRIASAVLRAEQMASGAEALGVQLRAEDGVGEAVRALEEQLRSFRM
mmetsp:Transcript_73254/g.226229  ORF Transcript_73254/g.226229 Transcript_73254/m.226229 type:complete len:185 (-) Transcript_73254:8-562(-)